MRSVVGIWIIKPFCTLEQGRKCSLFTCLTYSFVFVWQRFFDLERENACTAKEQRDHTFPKLNRNKYMVTDGAAYIGRCRGHEVPWGDHTGSGWGSYAPHPMAKKQRLWRPRQWGGPTRPRGQEAGGTSLQLTHLLRDHMRCFFMSVLQKFYGPFASCYRWGGAWVIKGGSRPLGEDGTPSPLTVPQPACCEWQLSHPTFF